MFQLIFTFLLEFCRSFAHDGAVLGGLFAMRLLPKFLRICTAKESTPPVYMPFIYIFSMRIHTFGLFIIRRQTNI